MHWGWGLLRHSGWEGRMGAGAVLGGVVGMNGGTTLGMRLDGWLESLPWAGV